MSSSHRGVVSKTKRRTLSYDAIGIFLVSLISICSGLIFFCVKEKYTIEVSKEIENEMQILVRLANIDVSYQENNDKLVYLSGELRTVKKLNDPLFGVSIQSCKLKREVSMYQWTVLAETKEVDVGDRVKNEVVYQFEKRWVPELVRLDYKGHKNPTSFPIPPLTLSADAVFVGIFKLSPVLAAQITNFRPLKIMHQTAQLLEATQLFAEKKLPKPHLRNGALYFSEDPDNPKIGDVMVQFSFAGLSISEDTTYGLAETVSVIGRQRGKTIVRFDAQNGSAIELIRLGKAEPEELLLSHVSFDRVRVWTYRFFAGVAVFIGIALVSAIVPAIGRPRFVPVWLAALLGHNRVILHIGTTISMLVASRCIVALFIANAPPANQSSQFAILFSCIGVIFVITKQAKGLSQHSKTVAQPAAAKEPAASSGLANVPEALQRSMANGIDGVNK